MSAPSASLLERQKKALEKFEARRFELTAPEKDLICLGLVHGISRTRMCAELRISPAAVEIALSEDVDFARVYESSYQAFAQYLIEDADRKLDELRIKIEKNKLKPKDGQALIRVTMMSMRHTRWMAERLSRKYTNFSPLKRDDDRPAGLDLHIPEPGGTPD